MKQNNFFSSLIRYFLQGLLVFAPILLTVYIIYWLLSFIDQLVPISIPGLGILIICIFIICVGYLSSTFLLRPIFIAIEEVINRTPLVKIIYSSLKDLFSAFVSNKKKFNKPVLVKMNRESDIKKMGFITQYDLRQFGLTDQVAVYLPHSYNFSGNLYIVPVENITLLKGVASADAMKFIVSGGVTQIETNDEK